MDNFEFHNPTRIIFGKGVESQVGDEVAKYSKKVLIHYGGGSAIKSGLIDRVRISLKAAGVDFVELGGVQPNPRVALVREGIELCRKESISFILAVGGGSVIDSAKAIGVGVPASHDVWDFYEYIVEPQKMLDVGVVLTIPAAGSESSSSSVVSNEEKQLKRGLSNEIMRPRFAFMNPELTFTLPPYQTACGAADIMAHIMERYFTNTKNVEFTDRLCEAGLKTIINNVPQVLENPNDYDARAEVMWTGCVAHNDLFNTGREGDWGSHSIEHEISALFDVAHGAGLAVIFPAWMKYVYKHDVARFSQFAERVWGLEMDHFNPEKTALAGIYRTEAFFRSIGLPVRLSEMDVPVESIPEMAKKCTGTGTTGNFIKLNTAAVTEIFNLAK
ncbi:MAG TPA: iron-containing alcohol dehydrogenase [Treponema sp.]|nr:iron-containing alcohol dehydrogenase [Treponema sp.]